MRLEDARACLSGRWRIALPPLRASYGLLALLSFAASSLSITLPARAVEYAEEITNRLNPTGRTVTFPVPMKDNGQPVGEVLIEITADDTVLVDIATLKAQLAGLLNGATATALQSLQSAHGGFVPIAAFERAGINLSFDSGLQELVLALSPEQRQAGDLPLGGRFGPMISSALTQPEAISGYLNVIAGLDTYWNTAGAKGGIYDDQPSARFEIESAIRVAGVVLDNRIAYEGDVDINVCPDSAICTFSHAAGLKRQLSRLIYDLPDEELRIMLGDTDPLATPLQRAADILGLSIEKSGRKLNPGDSIISTGSGSFRLERNASVEVFVNGASVQQLQLRPGNYTLRDLHLSTGANTIELRIVDDNGERQTMTFNSYSDPGLLAAGKNEWAVTAGLPSYLIDNQRTYASDARMATGFIRFGLTDDVTLEADAQADNDIAMAGGGIDFGTAFGVFGLHVAASRSASGENGAAFDFDYRLLNFAGIGAAREESLAISAEYRSTDFHKPGEFLSTASGILLPEYDYWLRLDGSYSVPVYEDVMATLSLRYQFDDKDRDPISAYRVPGDRYGADLTVSAPVTDMASASLTLGYSNELILRDLDERKSIDPEFRVGIRFNVRPDDTTSMSAGYDTLGRQASVSAYRSEGQGIGRWDTSVDLQSRGVDRTASASVSAGYDGNRAEVRVSHYADVDDFGFSDSIQGYSRQRTSLRAGTAIAFAGDTFAVGPPVRGGAFAILAPHETLAGRDVTSGPAEQPRARADSFGNGLISDLPAYQQNSTSIDVADLPLGYSLGSGSFDTFAPYKAGYVFKVGSENSVTVYGTLLKANGEPVSLLTGTAVREGAAAAPVAVFTNGEGRFGAEGLAPGRWVVAMQSESGVLTYRIDVPAGANGLVKVGTLQPTEERAP